jgi:PKD repeat protein
MKIMVCIVRHNAVAAALAMCVFIAGCGLDKSGVDPLTGPSTPSEFALSVTLTATPDQLPRDGSSQATVSVLVRDAQGKPVSGQRLSVGSSVGSVSQSSVVTNSEGRATFTFTAPPFGTVGNTAVVQVVPVSADGSNAVGRNVSILLTGTSNSTAPNPSFVVAPVFPVLQEPVVLDASATTDEGVRCGDACTYTWDFGGESTATGRIVSYRFRTVRTYAVKLTVTDPAGSSASITQNVGIGTGDEPAAVFTISPSAPSQLEAVQFNASSSRAGAGRTISSYRWNFGDGSTATGVTASHAYASVGTYQVTLTVTDNVGLTNTATNPVAVTNTVIAEFTFSPTDPVVRQTVVFNAEASRGSDGFGGRSPIVKYIWNFGDSEETVTTTSPRTSHSFETANTWTVTLTVEDSAGRRQTISHTVAVE